MTIRWPIAFGSIPTCFVQNPHITIKKKYATKKGRAQKKHIFCKNRAKWQEDCQEALKNQ
jgi:hypothetical protein